MRFVRKVVWNNYSAPAGATSSAIDISKVEFLLIYISVSAATTITLQVNTYWGWKDYDKISFTAAGEDFWNVWSLATDKIRFRVSSAATISLEVAMKT